MKKNFNLIFRSFVMIGILAIITSSCVPLKKTMYMQVRDDSDTLSNFVNERDIDYRVQPGDNLYIRVVTRDIQITMMLNPLSSVNSVNVGGSDGSIYLQSYTINEAGYLDFPMLGEIFVRNMNVDEIRDAISEQLKEYLKELIVIVKLVNYNITVLGEVARPGHYKIYQSSINIFEAVSLANDMSDFANAREVAIIRLTKTGSTVKHVDMTKRDILSSEYYYLKPNDILYVRPVKAKQFSFAQFPYGVVFTVISSTILIVTFIQAANN